MRTIIVAMTAIMLAVPACGDEIAGQMSQCMSMLPDEILAEPEIDMRVTLDDDGLVTRIDVLSYSPETPLGRHVAESAVRAVTNCQPYIDAPGEVTVTLPADSTADDIVVTFPDDPR